MISHEECYVILKIKRVIRDLKELKVPVPDQLHRMLSRREKYPSQDDRPFGGTYHF